MLRKFMHSGLFLLLVAGMSSAHVFAEDDKDLEKRADLAARVSCFLQGYYCRKPGFV